MPSRPHEELHEGMTRGTARGMPTRAVLVTLIAALLVLALGWAAVSVLGGDREAQAQSPDGGGSGELAQAAPEDGAGDGSGGESEPSYAAFGEERNPFVPVLTPAEEGEAGEGGDETAAQDQDPAQQQNGDPDGGAGANGGDGTTGSQGGDDSQQPSGATTPGGRNGGSGGNNVVTGPNGERVNCGNPVDEFERIICEEERGGSAAGTGAPGPGERQGPPGSGGSGRSGAGEPTEDFRNGGGGFVK